MATFKQNPKTRKSRGSNLPSMPNEKEDPTQQDDREMIRAWGDISEGKKSITFGGRKIYRPAAVKRAELREEQRKVFEQEFRKQNPMLMEMMDRVFADAQDVQAAIKNAVPDEIRNVGATAQGGASVLTSAGGALAWVPPTSLFETESYPWDKMAFSYYILATSVIIRSGVIREHFSGAATHSVDEKEVAISGTQTVSVKWTLATNATDIVAGKDNTDDTDEILYLPLYTFSDTSGRLKVTKVHHTGDWDIVPKQAPE